MGPTIRTPMRLYGYPPTRNDLNIHVDYGVFMVTFVYIYIECVEKLHSFLTNRNSYQIYILYVQLSSHVVSKFQSLF